MDYNGWIKLIIKVNDEPELILSISALILLLSWIIFRKNMYSIYDPFTLAILSEAMAFATGIATYEYGLFYEDNLIYAFIATELCFVIGLYTFSSYEVCSKNVKCLLKDEKKIKISFYIASLIFLVMFVESVFLVGIPAISMAMGDYAYENNYYAGVGLFVIIKSALQPMVLFGLWYFIFLKKKTILMKIYISIILVAMIIDIAGSGSKSAALIFVFTLWFFGKYVEKEPKYYRCARKINKSCKYILGLACLVAFLTMAIRADMYNDYTMVFNELALRIIGYGDGFVYYYVDNFHNFIETRENIFMELFGQILATLRIVDRDELPEVYTRQLWQLANHSIQSMGPNGRHNIIGEVYWGSFGGCLFSFAIGVTLGKIRTFVFNNIYRNYYYLPVLYVIYNSGVTLLTDPAMSITNLFFSICFMVIIYIIIHFIFDYNTTVKRGGTKYENNVS